MDNVVKKHKRRFLALFYSITPKCGWNDRSFPRNTSARVVNFRIKKENLELH